MSPIASACSCCRAAPLRVHAVRTSAFACCLVHSRCAMHHQPALAVLQKLDLASYMQGKLVPEMAVPRSEWLHLLPEAGQRQQPALAGAVMYSHPARLRR